MAGDVLPNLIRNPALSHEMLKRVQHDGLRHSELDSESCLKAWDAETFSMTSTIF